MAVGVVPFGLVRLLSLLHETQFLDHWCILV